MNYKEGKNIVMDLVEDGDHITINGLIENFGWDITFAKDVINQLINENKVTDHGGRIYKKDD
jgi:hypothetical protein